MPWTVVKGVYKQGVVEPLEELPGPEGAEVLVLFLTGKTGIWQQIKRDLAAAMPDVLNMTKEDREKEFDRLSEQIVKDMPYRNLEEFEQVMRGDEYGLVGH